MPLQGQFLIKINDRRFIVVMKKRIVFLTGLFVLAVIWMSPVVVSAWCSCLECHQKHGVTIKIPSTPPIRIMVDGKEQHITLDRAFRFHGHECPGMTIAYLAIRHGINLLYRNEIPERGDLLVTSRTPAGGVKDFIDFLMKGDKPSDRTWPPVGMEKGRDKFVFTVARKSTCEAVEIRLKEEFFPADFYPLKKKEQEKTITKDEWERLHTYMKDMLLRYPTRPAEELFSRQGPYKIITWGTLQPGELDKSIRKMRQEARKKALQGEENKPLKNEEAGK